MRKDEVNYTKDAIQKEFLSQYSRKEFSRITVKGLCASTPVARTTFYSYYQNTDELLGEIEDQLIVGLRRVAADVSGGELSAMDFNRFLAETVAFIETKWDVFTVLLVVQPDRRFENKLKAAIKHHFKMRYPDKCGVSNYELISEMMASAVLGAYCFWLQHPEKVQKEKFKSLLTQILDQFVSILR